MLTFNQSKQVALREKRGLVITNAVQYKDYYIFFMQPKGVSPGSRDALLDSYVIVNFQTGKVEHKSIFMFKDYFKNAKVISL